MDVASQDKITSGIKKWTFFAFVIEQRFSIFVILKFQRNFVLTFRNQNSRNTSCYHITLQSKFLDEFSYSVHFINNYYRIVPPPRKDSGISQSLSKFSPFSTEGARNGQLNWDFDFAPGALQSISKYDVFSGCRVFTNLKYTILKFHYSNGHIAHFIVS